MLASSPTSSTAGLCTVQNWIDDAIIIQCLNLNLRHIRHGITLQIWMWGGRIQRNSYNQLFNKIVFKYHHQKIDLVYLLNIKCFQKKYFIFVYLFYFYIYTLFYIYFYILYSIYMFSYTKYYIIIFNITVQSTVRCTKWISSFHSNRFKCWLHLLYKSHVNWVYIRLQTKLQISSAQHALLSGSVGELMLKISVVFMLCRR